MSGFGGCVLSWKKGLFSTLSCHGFAEGAAAAWTGMCREKKALQASGERGGGDVSNR